MPSYLLSTCIYALKAFLAFEREHRKGRVFIEDEREVVETCLDLLTRIQQRTVGPFGE